MHSIYIWYHVRPVAAPLVMRKRGYIRGMATVKIYPYPAERVLNQKDSCMGGTTDGSTDRCPFSF